MICGSLRAPIDDATAERLAADGYWYCCMDSAEAPTPVDSVRGCTCWRPVYDLEQADPVQGPAGARPEQCHDCAYLATTAKDPEAYPEQRERELLFELGPGEPFVCHQGMRRTVAWHHPERDITIDAPRAAYAPPARGGTAWKADGTPADLCAGWARLQTSRKATVNADA